MNLRCLARYNITQGFHFEGFFPLEGNFCNCKKKKEIQNKRKYEGNFKKSVKKIEKTLVSANVAPCNYSCNHKYSVTR